MLTPVAKKLLIRPVEEKPGIIIIHNKKPVQFLVISTGDEVTKVKPGDFIFLEKHYGIEIEHEGDKYLVIDEPSILAKLSS
jgi:co-chaperonin GroES (HSP10)